MTDPSQLTDAQLLALIGPQGAAQPRQPQRQATPRRPQGRGIDPATLSQMVPITAQTESNNRDFDAQGRYITSPAGARGRMQVMPATQRDPGFGVQAARDDSPEELARVGRDYLGAMGNLYGDPAKAWAAYNWGPGNLDRAVQRYGENWIQAAPAETQRYVDINMRALGRGGVAQPAPQSQAAPDLASIPDAELLALANGEAVAPASSAMNIRAPDLGNVVSGDAWAPWLTRPGRRVEQGGVTQGADGVTEVNLETPGIIDNGNGEFEIYDPETSAYYPATATEVAMLNRRLEGDLQKRREEEAQRDDPAYQAQYETARAKAENIPPWLANLTVGGTLGGIQEILALNAGLRGEGSQAARDAFKDRQDTLLAEDPTGTIGMQLAGGLLTPGLKGSGDFIAGASGAARTGRAAVVSGAYGGAASVLGGEGDLGERLQRAPLDIGVSAATGGILDSALVGATARSAAAQGQPATSAARRLSRRGVDLTPGQMLSEVPVVGPVAKYTEDIIGGFNPMMGGVRRNQNEQVIRAAGQEALDTIRDVAPDPSVATLPRNARTGYQVSQNVMRVLGSEYDDVLGQVTGQADGELYAGFDDMLNRAGEVLDDSRLSRLNRVLDQNIFSRFEEGGQLSGEQFKRIETTLRQQSERANRPNSTLEDVDLSEFLDESRDIVRQMIARQHPEQADRIQAINRGYAIAKRIQRATSGSAQMAREGTPLPGELTQTVAQMSNDASLSNQNGLLQGLASDARTVLPPGVGDTGSGQRAVIGGALGLAGTTGVAAVNPALAAGIAGGAVTYSPWGIQVVNAIYRATDPQARNQLMSELYRAASRNPALQPYYQAALEAAQSGAGNQSQAPAPATATPPAPIPQGMAFQ